MTNTDRNKSSDIALMITSIRAVGVSAFSPVLVAPHRYQVSRLLQTTQSVLGGLSAEKEDEARTEIKTIVNGAICRLDMQDSTLEGEAEDMSRESRRAANKSARAA